jgi:hypothetical protein
MVDSSDTATSFLTLRSHFSKTIRACWSIAPLEIRCTPCLACLLMSALLETYRQLPPKLSLPQIQSLTTLAMFFA